MHQESEAFVKGGCHTATKGIPCIRNLRAFVKGGCHTATKGILCIRSLTRLLKVIRSLRHLLLKVGVTKREKTWNTFPKILNDLLFLH